MCVLYVFLLRQESFDMILVNNPSFYGGCVTICGQAQFIGFFQLTLRGIKYDYKKGDTLFREFVPLAKLAIYNGKFAKLVHQQCKKKSNLCNWLSYSIDNEKC
jgi:hypothetical protein